MCVGGRLCVCVGVYVWEAVCVGRVYVCGRLSVCVWEALCVCGRLSVCVGGSLCVLTPNVSSSMAMNSGQYPAIP